MDTKLLGWMALTLFVLSACANLSPTISEEAGSPTAIETAMVSIGATRSPLAAQVPYPAAATPTSPAPALEIPYPILVLSRTPTGTSLPSPTPTRTPTPTQITPTPTLAPQFSTLRIVFNRGANLWRWSPGGESPLGNRFAFQDSSVLKLSDDGERILLTNDDGIWVIDWNGGGERLLMAAEAFKALEPIEPGVRLWQVDWLPSSRYVLFNTALQTEYGSTLTDDLYRIHADTGALEQLLPQHAGGNFFVSPDGKQIAVTSPEAIAVANADGSNRETLLEYEPIFTYSEYEYYPSVVWAADSGALLVALPPRDFFGEESDKATRIWLLPVDGGTPLLLSEIIMDPNLAYWREINLFSPDLQWLVYRPLPGTGQSEGLRLARTDGSLDIPITAGEATFYGWAPDSQHFVISGTGFNPYLLVDLSGNFQPILEDESGPPTWLEAEYFLYGKGPDASTLWLSNVAGPGRLLIGPTVDFREFDFQIP